MLPLEATWRNSSLAALILISVSAETASFLLTTAAVSLVSWRTAISSSSSTKLPSTDVSFSSRLSSNSFIVALFSITSSTSLILSVSKSDFSIRMTRPSSWSSSPFIVTVKSMIAVLALISGLYAGLPILVVMYRVNPSRSSISLSPTISFSTLPCLITFLSSKLFSTGSSSSSTSSISSGRPKDKLSSR